MGLLIKGQWHDQWYDTKSTGGRFERPQTAFHDWVSPEPGARFPAAAGRYHLYVSLACPWAHRTLIMRRLKGLENAISVSVVHPYMGEQGWQFARYPCATGDDLHGAAYLHQIYTRAQPDYTGRVTVPVLWDRESGTIINNESADILRMLDHGFAGVADPAAPDYYPEDLREEIDSINDRVYHRVNNGVYKAGFATTQEAYEEAVADLFAMLDELEARLAEQRYLAGERITEADWRLFTTLVRFDAVYVGHFKCNLRRIADYPNLWGYTRELYQVPGVAETVNLDHIKRHYYTSHPTINPNAIIPAGPVIDFGEPHSRGA